MIKHKDYYVEFYEELDKRLKAFALQQEQKDKLRLNLGKYDVKEPLLLYLFYRLNNEKNYYNKCRLASMEIDQAMIHVDTLLNSFRIELRKVEKTATENVAECPWANALQDYKGQLLVYLFNERQLELLTPLIREIVGPVLLLAEFELPEETDLPDNISVMPIAFSNKKEFVNEYIERYFPFLFYYANTFSSLLRFLSPKGILCLDGCHIQEHLLAVMGNKENIPVIGIQQGWPSMIYPGFRHLQYRYFFTWGERFNDIWRINNPFPKYLPMGNMFEAEKTGQKKDCVTFFLQNPFFLSSIHYFNELLDLVSHIAESFPNQKLWIREHPEYEIPVTVLEKWDQISNIRIVTDMELDKVYERTRIIVTHFSSSLMEGMIYGATPLVYGPTAGSRYYPGMGKEGIGKIAETVAEFENSLRSLLESDVHPLSGDNGLNSGWLASTGSSTLQNMVDFLNDKL